MRSLKQYIVESVHTYNYTIKIAGQVDKNFLEMFKFNLKKFDPIKISDPVSTPIQKSPYGFPDAKNEPVHIIKAEFRYPATEPMIQQIAQLLGYNVNMVRVVKTGYDESVTSEMEGYANQMDHSPVLTHEELEEQHGAKEAAKAYGNSYLDSIQEQTKDDKIDIPYEGTKTPNAFDPFKPESLMSSMGKDSPMSKISRPEKPKTGAMGGK
jgi:hypothetical protein